MTKKAYLISDLIDSYLQYLKLEKNYSEKTLEAYSHYLNRFLVWSKVVKINDLSPTLTENYRIRLYDYKDKNGRKLKAATRNYHLIALRNFLRYLIVRREFTVMSPERVGLGKMADREIKFLAPKDLRKLLSAPNPKTDEGKRDRSILELLFSTGLRVSELAALDRDKVNLETLEFSVVGKGGHARVVFISDRAARALEIYLKTRTDELPPLFIRYHGPKIEELAKADKKLRLSIRSIERLVKKYVHKAGLTIEATPHTMRHSFATDLLRAGADIREVQELLGHKNIATTQIYTHITNRELKDVHRKYHSGNK